MSAVSDKKHNTGLLDLPPELRIRIYEYLFGYAHVCCTVNPHGFVHRSEHESPIHVRSKPAETAILRCSRKIYPEAKDVLRKQTTLLVQIKKHYSVAPKDLLGKIDYCKSMRDVGTMELEVHLEDSSNHDFRTMMKTLRALDKFKHVKNLILRIVVRTTEMPSLEKCDAFFALYDTIECEGTIHLSLLQPRSGGPYFGNLAGVEGLTTALGRLREWRSELEDGQE